MDELVSTNFGHIKRKHNRDKRVECKICFKFIRSDNINRHMKRKSHIQHGLTATANKKISKKGRIEKICDMYKDEILTMLLIHI